MNKHEVVYSPGLVIAFVSATFGVLNFCSTCLSLDAQSQFSVGIMRAILGIVFFLCAVLQLIKGEVYGNINLIFSITFGFFSGTNTLISESSSLSYALIQPEIFAIVQILAGSYLGILLPVMRKLPFYQWMAYFCAAMSSLLLGIGNLTDLVELEYIAGLVNLLFAALSAYIGLRAIEERLPMGATTHQIIYEVDYETPKKKKSRHSFRNLLMEEEKEEKEEEKLMD